MPRSMNIVVSLTNSSNLRFAANAILLGFTCAVVSTQALADPPSILSMFRKTQPVNDEAIQLKAEHGPWLILASTFSGQEAMQKATALAKEIRTEMRLPAFVMERSNREAESLATRERVLTDAFGNQETKQLAFKYANPNSYQAYAVLVGEFNATEDPRAQETLERIQTAFPQCLSESGTPEDGDSTWLVQKYRSLLKTKNGGKKPPMATAFITRNPLLPDDFFQAPKVDKFVESLNKDEIIEYSLLDCPARFTVRVASFRGQDSIILGDGKVLGGNKEESEQSFSLDRAADTAHRLTMALRKQGAEAYEFHDRFGSYVMIGSFDTLGTELASGQFQYNPAILKIAQEYCGYEVVDVRDPSTGALAKRTTLKSLERIPFDLEGKPMAVPRPETSKLYSGSLLGGR